MIIHLFFFQDADFYHTRKYGTDKNGLVITNNHPAAANWNISISEAIVLEPSNALTTSRSDVPKSRRKRALINWPSGARLLADVYLTVPLRSPSGMREGVGLYRDFCLYPVTQKFKHVYELQHCSLI